KGSGASPAEATTVTRRGRSRAAARAALGGRPSVATTSGSRPRRGRDTPGPAEGKALASAKSSTSPPPVWTSSTASARTIRSARARAYPQGGRASVARPSNQEKSQPSVGTAAPSATSSSKERPRPAPADPLATEPSLTVHQILTPAAASGRDSLPTRRQERSP